MLVLAAILVIGVNIISGGLLNEKPYYDLTDEKLCHKVFEEFIQTYNKAYQTEEEKKLRYEIFLQNLAIINEYNVKSSSTHDVNKFSDLTVEEFRAKYTGYIPNKNVEIDECLDISNISLTDVPDSFDWRDKNVVSEVKNQGDCRSCWAFSAIGNVESQYAMKYSKIIEFSEQQLVSCDRVDAACQGGFVESALAQLKEMGGVELENDYPYTSGFFGENGTCKFDNAKIKAKIANYTCIDLRKTTEDQLKSFLYENGPVSIYIAASRINHYKEGVIHVCDDIFVDHAVLLVGYGVEDGVPYWLIKNSWGKSWGLLGGYFKIKRGNNCLSLMNETGVISTVA